MRPEIETLVGRAQSLGATFHVEGTKVKVSAPEPLPTELMSELRVRKAALVSFLALPEVFRPTVRWATWMVEQILEDEATVRFSETALRSVALRLSDVGRYLSEVLGRLSLLRSCEGSGVEPGWRIARMRELCDGLDALREALRPLGLAELGECPE